MERPDGAADHAAGEGEVLVDVLAGVALHLELERPDGAADHAAGEGEDLVDVLAAVALHLEVERHDAPQVGMLRTQQRHRP